MSRPATRRNIKRGEVVERELARDRQRPRTLDEERERRDQRMVDGMSDDVLVLVIRGYRAGLSATAVRRALGLPAGRADAVFHIMRDMKE